MTDFSKIADIKRQLAEQKCVAVIWSVDDVKSLNPDLTDEDAWRVLQSAERYPDPQTGINWNTLQNEIEWFVAEQKLTSMSQTLARREPS